MGRRHVIQGGDWMRLWKSVSEQTGFATNTENDCLGSNFSWNFYFFQYLAANGVLSTSAYSFYLGG